MTEIEVMQRAKFYMDQLAQGIDPISGKEMPEDSTLNQIRLARCFFYVSDILGKVIANGGSVGERGKLLPFTVDQELLSRVRVSQEPVRITQLVDLIAAAVNNPKMKKPKTTTITDWLLEKGFLEVLTESDGKNRRVPTQNGLQIGLFLESRQGQYGEYHAVFYNPSAQQFVLDHLKEIFHEA